jgi:hypothetical protein
MTTSSQTIGPLTKVTLALDLNEVRADGSPSETTDISFIYGLGAEGITPFEKALHGKSPQESVNLKVEAQQAHSLFGHLACDILAGTQVSPPFELKATVVSVEKAKDRDLVKAMAKSSQCGSGCDCGCGC